MRSRVRSCVWFHCRRAHAARRCSRPKRRAHDPQRSDKFPGRTLRAGRSAARKRSARPMKNWDLVRTSRPRRHDPNKIPPSNSLIYPVIGYSANPINNLTPSRTKQEVFYSELTYLLDPRNVAIGGGTAAARRYSRPLLGYPPKSQIMGRNGNDPQRSMRIV